MLVTVLLSKTLKSWMSKLPWLSEKHIPGKIVLVAGRLDFFQARRLLGEAPNNLFFFGTKVRKRGFFTHAPNTQNESRRACFQAR